MAIALERYLKDFGQPETFVLSEDIGLMGEQPATAPVEQHIPDQAAPAAPLIDIEAEKAAAFENGKQEAAVAFEASLNEQMEAERSKHREEINELRTRYEQDFSTVIATRYDTLSNDLVETIGSQVTAILAPLFERTLSEKMIDSLAETMRLSLRDRAVSKIAVTGSASMFDALKEALADDAAQLEFIEGDAFDLTIRIDDTVLSTRLSEWADRLRELLP
ncbi:hypothetical protein [Hoeflea sp. TYP-13]|uniref:hypothetical protein n=1 Tax=Hoeflea sp. TYP-13 TaxID=3230023 RepID=UPI0034C68B29